MQKILVRDKKFYKTVLVLASPVVLQSVITIAVNMLDNIMLGSYGEVQISGSSLANSFVSIFQVLCFGIGGGAAVLTAQFWGAKNVPAIRKIIALMLRVSMVVAFLFFIAAVAFPEAIMSLYASDPEIIAAGAVYLRLVSPTFLLSGLTHTVMIVLRSVREVKLPMINACVAFVSNLFFNWLLIFGNLGMPELQIRGAAIATVIARVIETCVIIWYILKKDRRIELRPHHLIEPCSEYLPKYWKYSCPVILSDFLLGLGNTAVSMIVGHMSTPFVAANSIIAMTVRLSTVMNQAFSNAGSIMTGNTLGEGDVEKAHTQGFTFLLMSLTVGLIASGLLWVLCPFIIGMYNLTDETVQIAMIMMKSVSITVVFQATQSMLTKGVLRGGGDTKFLMVADILFMWLLSIPLGYLSAYVWHLDVFWIYTLMKIDYVVKSIWCTFRLAGNKWIKRIARSTDGPKMVQ